MTLANLIETTQKITHEILLPHHAPAIERTRYCHTSNFY